MKNILQRAGVSLYEVILAAAIFALTATMFAGAFVVATQSRAFAADQDQATFLAEEGLETARNIRDTGFIKIATGTWGLAISGGHWTLAGSSDTTGIFKRQVAISTFGTTTDQILSSVSWTSGKGHSSTISLVSQLVSFATPTAGACLAINVGSTTIGGTNNVDLLGITLGNSCATSMLTPTAVTVSWTNASNLLNTIEMNGVVAWMGSDASGGTLPISGFTLPEGTSTTPINLLAFSKSMTGDTFTIVFTMDDGSTQTVSFSPP